MLIRVYGTPAAQGSKIAMPVYRGTGSDRTFTGRVNLLEQAGEKLTTWREAVQAAAAEQRAGRCFAKDVPLLVVASFYMKRPAGHYGTGANAGTIKPSAPDYPTGRRNDIDKLERAILDGLTAGGAWHDDGQVVGVIKWKYYADPESPGCEIMISRAPVRPRQGGPDD